MVEQRLTGEEEYEEKMDDDNDEMEMNEEQLEEYREMLIDLGPHPDKVLINTLSMVAEDYSDSMKCGKSIYDNIRTLLVSTSISPDCKLPLVYVIDSLLKNVGGVFVSLVAEDASKWIPLVFGSLGNRPEYRAKLKKVLMTWKDGGIFSLEVMKEMSKCFDQDDAATALAAARAKQAEAKYASLDPALREEMKTVLDNLYENESELDKLSLERLVVYNSSLFDEIKNTALVMMKEKGETSSSSSKSNIFKDNRPEQIIQISLDWEKTNFPVEQAHELVSKLQSYVKEGSCNETPVSLLSSASATANHVTMLLKNINDQLNQQPAAAITTPTSRIDGSLFTTENISNMSSSKEWIIGQLYDQGLPFVSSSDGRRFKTQIQLSSHLDALFRKNQIEKTMTKNEERGWYASTSEWTLKHVAATSSSSTQQEENAKDPQSFRFFADETRSKCRICGVSFEMYFDQHESDFMYRNCFEMDLLQEEEVQEPEKVLVHETCRRGLGSPEYLNMNQVL